MTIDPDDYDLRELRRIADERREASRSDEDEQSGSARGRSPRAGRERRRGPGGRRRAGGEQTDRRTSREGREDREGRGDDSRDRRARRDQNRERGQNRDRDRDERSADRRRNGRIEDERRGDHAEDRRRDDAGRRDTGRPDEVREPQWSDDGDRDGRRLGDRDDLRRGDREGVRDVDRDRSGRTDRRGRNRGDQRDRDRDRDRRAGGGTEVSPPRRGGSDHADGHDQVVQADRIASDLGFGDQADERQQDEDRRRREDRQLGRSAPEQPTGPDAWSEPADDVGQFQFDTEVRERPRGRAGKALRKNQLEQLLVHETAAAGDGLAKPYLGSIPDEYAAERIVFDWLEFLVLKGGFKRTMDALRYYHTVDWLTEAVEAELQDYLVGFSGEVSNTAEFDVDDHHLSLVYIARLASMT